MTDWSKIDATRDVIALSLSPFFAWYYSIDSTVFWS